MPRGHQRIVIAALGCISLAASNPPHRHTQQRDARKDTSAAAEPAPPKYAPYPDRYADSCYQAKDHDAAELCAEWRSAVGGEKAAHEARRATNWAIIATFLSAASFAGLILTIWQTRGALAEARTGNRLAMKANARATRQAVASAADTQNAIAVAKRQADIAEDTSRRTLRAYIVLKEARYGPIKPGLKIKAELTFTNSGVTPAYDFQSKSSLIIRSTGHKIKVVDPDYAEQGAAVIGKGGENLCITETDEALTPALLNDLSNGTKELLFIASAIYKDAFDQTRKTTVILRAILPFGTGLLQSAGHEQHS